MRLDRALEQISEIHEQMAKGQMYRGYRAIPSAAAGGLALIAAWVQPLVIGSAGSRVYILY